MTGEGRRPKTPAERLGLSARRAPSTRAASPNAIYFEARGEAERGQMAVAQVVLNRAFSGYYPDNVCDVVYQNAHRHLACQFTFACDGIRDVVTEPDAWEAAKRIARDIARRQDLAAGDRQGHALSRELCAARGGCAP